VINTDAHAIGHLDNMRYGVFQARRAGLTAGDVLNTLPYERFREALASRRATAGRASSAPATDGAGKTPRRAQEPAASRPTRSARAEKTPAVAASRPRPGRAVKAAGEEARLAPAASRKGASGRTSKRRPAR